MGKNNEREELFRKELETIYSVLLTFRKCGYMVDKVTIYGLVLLKEKQKIFIDETIKTGKGYLRFRAFTLKISRVKNTDAIEPISGFEISVKPTKDPPEINIRNELAKLKNTFNLSFTLN